MDDNNVCDLWFAAGCFWGAEKYFKLIDGVLFTEVGYANGNTENPTYKQVYTDTTGYAETVRVCYDPSVLPLEDLLRDYFCAIDPLSVNRQGEDEGTRYRTGIYYSDPEDLPAVRKVYEEVQSTYGVPIAVEVDKLRNFYAAEDRHQDYLVKNPDGYCHLPLKLFRYPKLVRDLEALLGGEPDRTARLADAAALIKERMGFFWVGFYLVRKAGEGKELVLGPFQGPVACMRIGFGRGVCGTAWKESRTIVVPDVEEFPGHIACSSLSRSEIVVPIRRNRRVTGVLDIDSTELSTFDRIDAFWLEKLVQLL